MNFTGATRPVAGWETDMPLSWGRTRQASHLAFAPAWLDEAPPTVAAAATARPGRGTLAVGLGRSYGDSSLNPDGAVILASGLDRFIALDRGARRLRAEAGMSFAALLDILVPLGLFVPVTPGTRNVTLGGAVANDVHGKNHHGAGTLGRWVRALGLVRSDGAELTLTPDDDSKGVFAATIGGLGLTGMITWVEVELIQIASASIEVEEKAFDDLNGFFALSADAEAAGWEYTVAWVDCLAQGRRLGRGLFTRGRHAPSGAEPLRALNPSRLRHMPMEAPGWLLNRYSIAAFNALYHAKGRFRSGRRRVVPYLQFFYPLDAIADWNRLYGRRGMYQYQCVIPPEAAAAGAVRELLEVIAQGGEGSFLAVLKNFGDLPSPGLLSFPMKGTTLALDFANRGDRTLRLLARLDETVLAARGRLYPAKDGRMPAAMFRAGFPDWERFARIVDPGFSSSFWRRVAA